MPENTPTPHGTARPWGRTLSDLWLDGEEGKLHPAEWKLLECAALGEECVLGSERPSAPTVDNRIRADLLRFIALGGDDETPLHEKGVQLMGAFVDCDVRDLDFQGCQIPENLHLHRCTIDGNLVLRDTLFETLGLDGSAMKSLRGDRCKSTGTLAIRFGFRTSGEVRLPGAKIGGSLDCSKAIFEGGDRALICDGIEIDGSIFLNSGFRAVGKVLLIGAKIGGDLDCSKAIFEGDDHALICDGIEIDGNIFLCDGFRSVGDVRLLGAKIGLDFECSNGTFLAKPVSLVAQGAMVSGSVFLCDEFLARGSVDFLNVKVGDNFECHHATFSSKDQSLFAPRMSVGGNVTMGKECRVAGQVSFQGATIGGDVTFQGGSFEGKPAITLKNAKIDGALIWRGVDYCRGELNLAGASCLTLNMDWASWEKPAQIRLDAFTYQGFSELPEGCNAQFWKRWLEQQPDKHLNTRFRPNPYSQLADVLNRMGHEQEAVSVRVEQRRRQSAFTRLYEPVSDSSNGRLMRNLIIFWNFMQGLVVDYGYRPGKALFFLFGIVAVGAVIYHLAARDGIMAPTHPLIFKEAGNLFPKECTENWVYFPKAVADKCAAGVPSEYSEFSSLIYSLDTALPIVNFRMEDDWSPRVVTTSGDRYWPGWWVRTWEWVQIALGWLLSLLFASAIGGIIRR